MRIAILADVHGNLEAFRACLEHAKARGAERIVLLGERPQLFHLIGTVANNHLVNSLACRLTTG